VRIGAYVALGASAFIPLLHGIQVYGLEYMLEYSGMEWYLVELLLYGGGCGLYVVCSPPSAFPSLTSKRSSESLSALHQAISTSGLAHIRSSMYQFYAPCTCI
jgi:adiponectin receptor